jgi:spore germination protein PD
MNFQVINEHVSVGSVHLISISSASAVKVGDTEVMQLFTASDTPPRALEFGPLQPIVAR